MNYKELLWQKRKTQRDIAKYMKIDPSTISLWVNQVSPVPQKHIAKLAKYLGVSEKTFGGKRK